MESDIIRFIREKNYRKIKRLAQGGYGETFLIEDEIINEHFVCKKYSPYYSEDKEIYFKNFIQEIKFLHLVYHKNIVRVFNYYLYPEHFTGYILMEYVKGWNIHEYLKSQPDKINEIFVQTIEGFSWLESLKILHRDIRPQNILVTEDGIVKIIDFGFGKQIEFGEENFDKSISLNWPYTVPSEFHNQIYNFSTELYFVGKLFEEIIHKNGIRSFAYSTTIRKMIPFNLEERYSSFNEVERAILEIEYASFEFSHEEKQIYSSFADGLINIYVAFYTPIAYISDVAIVIQELEKVYASSTLEVFLQYNGSIARCFVEGKFKFSNTPEFAVKDIARFVKFFKTQPIERQKVILNNIWQRLDKIQRIREIVEDDLPF